ncbi:hypothetical protein EDD86DRAFT_214742 [Gorgonomyces haynaldii]|nr:hypothetical protein EDD86DRAFT_214742 [Gorgonomyces haynaldii]
MDDSSLKSLTVTSKPSGQLLVLVPAFSRHIKEYQLVCQSDTTSVSIKAIVNEGDAFSQVQRVQSDGTVPIKEGQNEIVIKVDAADKSFSNYVLKLYKPSESDTSLSSIECSGILSPTFSRQETNYTLQLPSFLEKTQITLKPLNAKSQLEIVTGDTGLPLHSGDTVFQWKMTSADKKQSQIYTIVCRKEYNMVAFESLDICHFCETSAVRPRQTKCGKIFCGPCVRVVSESFGTKCPVCGEEDQLNGLSDQQLESRIDQISVSCPNTAYGCDQKQISYQSLTVHLKSCTLAPVECIQCHSRLCSSAQVKDGKHLTECVIACPDCGKTVTKSESQYHKCITKMKIGEPQKPNPLSVWQEALVDKKLILDCEQALAKESQLLLEYTESLEKSIKSSIEHDGLQWQTPKTSCLEEAKKIIGSAISKDNESVNLRGTKGNDILHVHLGLLCEELQYVNDTFPNPISVSKEKSNDNEEASNGFMQDEVDGLLMQLVVAPSASDTVKLRAIEQEYQRLKGLGQTDQAAEVQTLYQWKLNQMKTNFVDNQEQGSQSSTGMAQAIEKYRDALRINPASFEANLYLGRALVMNKAYDEALSPLQIALAQKPTHKGAKFYLGCCLVHLQQSTEEQRQEAIVYLSDSIEYLRVFYWSEKPSKSILSLGYESIYHPLVFESYLSLGLAYCQSGQIEKASSILHQGIGFIKSHLNKTPKSSAFYAKLIYGILDAQILNLRMASFNKREIASKQTSQASLVMLSMMDELRNHGAFKLGTRDLLTRLVQASQMLLFKYPDCPYYWTMIGQAHLDLHDIKPDTVLLDDAIKSFESAIHLENPDNQLQVNVSWFKRVEEETKSISQAILNESKQIQKTGESVPKQQTNKTGGKADPKAAKPKADPKAAAPSKPADKSKPVEKPAAKPAEKSSTKPVEKTADKPPIKIIEKPDPKPKTTDKTATKAAEKPPAKIAEKPGTKTTKPAEKAAEKQVEKPQETAKPRAIPDPAPTYSPFKSRMGLARALNRLGSKNNQDRIISLYRQAIQMKPNEHDAYIELAEILEKVSLDDTVNLYTSFPFSAEPSQDDLFLYVEINRLLMKSKQFTHEKLLPSLIAEGRGNGIKSLSKYVEILDAASQSKLLMALYAGVNRKPETDPELVQFFKARYWL